MPSDIQILSSPDELAALHNDWDALVDRSVYPNFFLRTDWMLSWWKWFGNHLGTFHVFLIRDGDRLIGGLPLFRERSGRLKLLGFDGLACPEYLGLVVEADRVDEVARRCADYLVDDRSWSELFFEDYAVEDPGTSRFVELLEQRFPSWQREGEPRYFISLPKTYEDYLKTRSSRNRQKKRHDLRIALENYHARLVEPDAEEIDRWFPVLQHLSRSSIGRKVFPPLMRKNFAGLYRDLLVELLPKREARVFMLYYDDTPAAFFAGFAYRGKFYSYQTGFDPGQPGRPGNTVVQMLLMRLIEEEFHDFDFLRGLQEYKRFWTESLRPTRFVVVFRRKGVAYRRTLFIEHCLRPAWRKLKTLRARFLKPKTTATEKES